MRSAKSNTFTAFLNLLKVKHTNDFSNQYFNEHPHKYNLFGLSKMLSDYGVANAGTRITDKENDLPNIECPFVAKLGDFVVVYKIESGKVHYLWNGKKIAISVEQFLKWWSGVILLAETAPNSIEPDYKEHRKKELFGIAQKALLILAGILLFGIGYYQLVYQGIAGQARNDMGQLGIVGLRSDAPATTTTIQLFSHSVTPLFSYSVIDQSVLQPLCKNAQAGGKAPERNQAEYLHTLYFFFFSAGFGFCQQILDCRLFAKRAERI